MELLGDRGRYGVHSLPAGIFQAAQEQLFGRVVTDTLRVIQQREVHSLVKAQQLPVTLQLLVWRSFSLPLNLPLVSTGSEPLNMKSNRCTVTWRGAAKV